MITFTSSSTVTNFVRILHDCGKSDILASFHGASIGPVTTETAEREGLPIILEAEEHTIPGLVTSIENYFKTEENV
jgi:uroporphyrinogen III methyltransferase/synthase